MIRELYWIESNMCEIKSEWKILSSRTWHRRNYDSDYWKIKILRIKKKEKKCLAHKDQLNTDKNQLKLYLSYTTKMWWRLFINTNKLKVYIFLLNKGRRYLNEQNGFSLDGYLRNTLELWGFSWDGYLGNTLDRVYWTKVL